MIQPLIIITGILLMVYALLILYYHRIWDLIPISNESFDLRVPVTPVRVSVIIPARNEFLNIGNCLDSLFNQSYPKEYTEVIVVDDHSTDNTANVVLKHKLNCTILKLSDNGSENLNSYKKKAIEMAIVHSSGELIICTDADCTMGPHWINSFVSAYNQRNLHFIAAPVKIVDNRSWLSFFQALDFISLQGITGVAVYKNLYPMCNGANLAYTRLAFQAVKGFMDINHIASGDDMLLMKKIQACFPGKTGYIKNRHAMVSTCAAENIHAFLNQRIRWSSKIWHYKHTATFLTLGLVFLVNASLILLFITCFFFGHWRWFLILLTFKTISEYFFVSKVAHFFQQKYLMKYFPLCQPFHILYTVIAGSFGSFGKYEWKNRKVK